MAEISSSFISELFHKIKNSIKWSLNVSFDSEYLLSKLLWLLYCFSYIVIFTSVLIRTTGKSVGKKMTIKIEKINCNSSWMNLLLYSLVCKINQKEKNLMSIVSDFENWHILM